MLKKLLSTAVLAAASGILLFHLSAAPAGKITICHVPPGNQEAAHDIEINANALEAHLAHGDSDEPCGEQGPSTLSIVVFTSLAGAWIALKLVRRLKGSLA